MEAFQQVSFIVFGTLVFCIRAEHLLEVPKLEYALNIDFVK